ncbi:MAG: hypothetical protein JSR19_06950 [Proteobacteria bacterium]|nr:hypothetical protein [Pseudomonadota bacterium]HQR02481.1 hypothetical protein [Rhodocyclaceae bacterium]
MSAYDDLVDEVFPAAPTPGAAPNPYLQTIDDIDQQQRARAALTVGLSVGSNPDKSAANAVLARRYNVPPEVVDTFPEEFKQRAVTEAAKAALRDAPTLARSIADNPALARVIHDVVPGTAAVEQAVRAFPEMTAWDAPEQGPTYRERLSNWWRGLFGAPTVEESRRAQQAAEATAILVSKRPGMTNDEAWEASRQAIGGMSQIPQIAAERFVDSATFGLVAPVDSTKSHSWQASTAGALGQLSGFLVGPAKGAGALINPLEHVAGESFVKALSKDVINQGATLALASALEKGGHAALDTHSLDEAGKMEADALAGGFETGGIFGAAGRVLPDNTALMAVLRAIGVNTATSLAQGTSPWDERVPLEDRIFNVLLNSVFSLHGAGRTGGGWLRDATESKIAEQDFQRLNTLSQVSAASALRERDPEAFKRFISTVADEGNLDSVYVDARTLTDVFNQSGVKQEDVARLMPDVAGQLHEALQTNGDVRIPVADYATHIAGSPADAALLPHLKTGPEGKTYAEAQEFYQGQADQFKTQAGKILAEHANDEAFKADHQQVFDKVLDQLNTANRFTPDVNKAYASLVRDYYVTTADRLGTKPSELFERYPLKVAVERMTAGGKHFDQAARVDQQLDQWVKGELPSGHIIDLGKPSAILRGFIPEDAPIHLAKRVLDKATDERHNILPADLKGLHEAIQSPIAVFASKKGEGHAVVVTELAHEDGNIVAALELNKKRNEIEVHDIRSLHPKADKSVAHWLKDGLLLGYEKTKGRAWLDRIAGSNSLRGQAEAALTKARIYEAGADSNGDLLQGNRGAYNPETSTIALLKGADLSTFLHETGHHFLEMTADLAAQKDAPPAIRADFDKLLKWFGVRDAAEWHNLSFEEKRSYHEQFARGFESYLMEGKAPNVELQGLFSRFRSWLLNVYKSLSGLNVELTPEVRGVFDRMLASEEAIQTAEQVRGYEPLFKSATDAGMTPEQWADYQKLGAEATETAVDDMEKRSLRDMKWLSNAKAGALKEKQKEAASKRREVRTEVSKEVWSQPVYQAWQFLTGKEEGGKAVKPKASKGLDSSRDSLFTAIGKLGGIDKKQLVSEWGMDGRMSPESGVFGKPVARATEGRTLDGMAEALADHGYLSTDEHGKWDLREFEEKFFNELGGKLEYSNHADYDYLKNGPEGPKLADLKLRTAGRLDTDAVRALGADGLKVEALRMTKKGGLDPDLVAEMHGFEDGADLVRSLANAEKPRDVIDGLTDQRMLERYGELSDPQAIERAAEAAIHNEVRARFVATELKALSQATGPAKLIAQAAKEAADAAIATKRVRDVRPAQYTAAEAKSAKNADKALLAKDIVAAANEKRAQLLNNRLAKAAADAVEEVRKGVDYLKKFDKPGVRENIELEYRDQIDALLERYDLRKSTSGKALDKREALLQFVERMAGEGYEPNIPEHLLNEAQRQHYKDMTVEQFRGLVDAVKSIEHLGRLKTRLLDGQETRELATLAAEATATMGELPQRTPESNRGLTRMESAWLSAKAAGRSAQAALLKMEQMFDWLDRRNPNGVFNRVVFRRIADAGTHENDMLATVKGEIDKLLDTNLADVTKDKGRIYVADGLIDGMTGKPQRFTKKQMLMLAGNMGNESNVAKLIAGEKWNEVAVWDFLNKNMSKADWDFVAGMGKAIESLWPEKLAMSRRLGNTNPEKIQPRAFDTPHGRYDGWYWPMLYDPARAQDVAERGAKKADALFENIYTRANTDTGRMNTRNANYARPLLLDLDALPRVIRDEIHDIAFREAILDADKFLSDGRVCEGIINALSQEHYDQLRPWLQSIANDGKLDDSGMRALKWFNDLARGARTRATMVGLGYRISTMLVHGTSAGLESIAELGPGWFAKGLRDFSNPMQWAANRDFIFERSREMRNRMNEVDRDVREHLRQIDLELMSPTTSAAARASDAIKAHAYHGIAMLDMASALPTWMGAYHKAMAPVEKGGLALGEQDAIYFADKTVRNAHGGTGVKDQAAVQRGPEFFKLFTMFYTFWNHNVNRIMDTYRMGKELPATYRAGVEAGDMAKFRGDLSSVLMRTLIYTFGVQIMHGMLHPPKEGDEEDSWFKWAAKEVTAAAFAGIPIARDLSAHYLQGKDYKVTPAASMVDAFDSSGKDAINAMVGDTVSDKWLKHMVTTSGYVFGLPTGQAASVVQFLWDVAHGQQNPQELADWWRGIIHGDMRKH